MFTNTEYSKYKPVGRVLYEYPESWQDVGLCEIIIQNMNR